MSYGEFVVPEEREFLMAFGCETEPVAGEDWVRSVKFSADLGEVLWLIFDVPGRSVRIRWYSGSRLLLDTFRESATLLRIDDRGAETYMRVEFELEHLAGALVAQVVPVIRVSDSMLFT